MSNTAEMSSSRLRPAANTIQPYCFSLIVRDLLSVCVASQRASPPPCTLKKSWGLRGLQHACTTPTGLVTPHLLCLLPGVIVLRLNHSIVLCGLVHSHQPHDVCSAWPSLWVQQSAVHSCNWKCCPHQGEKTHGLQPASTASPPPYDMSRTVKQTTECECVWQNI